MRRRSDLLALVAFMALLPFALAAQLAAMAVGVSALTAIVRQASPPAIEQAPSSGASAAQVELEAKLAAIQRAYDEQERAQIRADAQRDFHPAPSIRRAR